MSRKNDNVFSALRCKFIAIIMVVVAAVMALSFSAICFARYQSDDAAVRSALSDAVTAASQHSPAMDSEPGQHGIDPQPPSKPAGEQSDDQAVPSTPPSEDAPSNSQGEPVQEGDEGEGESAQTGQSDVQPSNQPSDQHSRRPSGEGTHGTIHVGKPEGKTASSLIPVAVYRIPANSSEDISLVGGVGTAEVSEEISEEALESVSSAREGFGRIDSVGLVYNKMKMTTGNVYIALTDSSYIDGWHDLAVSLFLVWFAALAMMFVVCLFLSKWALRPVRDAWDAQRQFVADASHDLKTPLTVILANMSILLQSPGKTIASESQWIENTQREARGMQQLVSEMLELAQVESAPERALAKERMNLSELLEEQCLLFDAMAIESGTVFEWEPSETVFVMGDRDKLAKMLSTLLENAFKYAGEGGRIDVVMRRSSKDTTVAIANSGLPIDPDDLPHIFERFYRADKARTGGEGGFGLGLAIAQEIAVQHGGDIACESSAKKGTVFTVRLPLS